MLAVCCFLLCQQPALVVAELVDAFQQPDALLLELLALLVERDVLAPDLSDFGRQGPHAVVVLFQLLEVLQVNGLRVVSAALFLSCLGHLLTPDLVDLGLDERYFFQPVARVLPVLVQLVDGTAGLLPADFLVDASVEPAAARLALFPGLEPVVLVVEPVFLLLTAGLYLCGQVCDVVGLVGVQYPAVVALLFELNEQAVVLALEDGRPGLVLEELVRLPLQPLALFVGVEYFLLEGARLPGKQLLLGAQA